MSIFKKFLSALIIAASILGWPAAAANERIVAIGDVHGDLDHFVALLQRASVLDSNRHWSGRNAILVQTGDLIDRGPKSRAVLDLMMQLQKEAPRQNGRVFAILGNHEVMNIYGDLRYVTPGDYVSYADEKSEQRRKTAYQAYANLADASPRMTEEEWMQAHPAGFMEHREAFGPEGKYGKWLRSLPAVAKINDSIFLHGGLKGDFASWKLEEINARVADELKSFDAYKKYMIEQKVAVVSYTLKELTDAATAASKDPKQKDPEQKKLLDAFLKFGTWLTINADGPLWFRGYAEWQDTEGAPQLDMLTKTFGVSRFIVGHTPQAGTIAPRLGGRVYLIDTGMLTSYFPNGRPSALEIQGDKLTPIYLDQTKPQR